MTKATSSKICSRELETKEIARSCAGLDHDEDTFVSGRHAEDSGRVR